MQQFTKRLLPGQDLRTEIDNFVKEKGIQAGCLIGLVGSLDTLTLRMAGGEVLRTWENRFEIVSATGIVSVNGSHIHISASNEKGEVLGGHLKKGCRVVTTAEVVILKFDDQVFKRITDPNTGFHELVVE